MIYLRKTIDEYGQEIIFSKEANDELTTLVLLEQGYKKLVGVVQEKPESTWEYMYCKAYAEVGDHFEVVWKPYAKAIFLNRDRFIESLKGRGLYDAFSAAFAVNDEIKDWWMGDADYSAGDYIVGVIVEALGISLDTLREIVQENIT